MSIQSSINSALGSVEQTLLRAGTLLKTHGTEPEDKKQPEGTEQEGQPREPMPAQPINPAEQIITQGNITAGAIASGRVQAKQQQRRQFIEESQARLELLKKKGKSPGSREVRKLKKDLVRTRRELVKEGS